MINDTSTWLILALAVIGVTAAIAVFLKTPKEKRYRGSPPVPLDEQLKSLPASAQAVIIKGNKRRALIKSSPYFLIGIVLAGYSMWIKDMSHPECMRLMGINASYISLLVLCYGLPIGIFLASLAHVGNGIKTLKTGRFPPLDAAVFNDTISRKGASSVFRGVLLLALPVFSLFLMYLGNSAYSEIAKGKNMHEITESLEAKCQ
jgi:hypothetical protein